MQRIFMFLAVIGEADCDIYVGRRSNFEFWMECRGTCPPETEPCGTVPTLYVDGNDSYWDCPCSNGETEPPTPLECQGTVHYNLFLNTFLSECDTTCFGGCKPINIETVPNMPDMIPICTACE